MKKLITTVLAALMLVTLGPSTFAQEEASAPSAVKTDIPVKVEFFQGINKGGVQSEVSAFLEKGSREKGFSVVNIDHQTVVKLDTTNGNHDLWITVMVVYRSLK